ncbi:hypothetical protein DSCO28_03490 [Desulfosarcina ovata subsp. sediminis]|uniref:Spore protein YkvP/CgeB glycosyl transferase-like domain-containing protein n=1 Tax=Desulfosarcina ovata subsp. sediminis TaxID=885957 RepID=A0A5K7ZQP2_9BACT|nr:glycosyltransferase [Desulfosarcina ovata]BBO79783.1 hypothetical protein DSCO28_03490 [Desulfosarcina ovata subsp. sediminis]
MKILFVCHPYPNYVPDLLLHGLRTLMGTDVVDYPRKNCLYSGVIGLGICSDDLLCKGWFPEDAGRIDRDDIQSKLKNGFFDYVVCDLRAISFLRSIVDQTSQKVVLIDGEDKPAYIPPGPYVVCRRETDGTDYSIPLPMALPPYIFKWISKYDHSEKRYSIGFLGSSGGDGQRKAIIDTIQETFPDSLLQATLVPSKAAPNPDGRLSREDYYRNLQQCKIVLSLSGEGHDTFRFWENAAVNAVHLSSQSPLFIPNDFQTDQEIVRFASIPQLKQIIETILDHSDQYQSLATRGRAKLLRYHMTQHRAEYFMDRIRIAFA